MGNQMQTPGFTGLAEEPFDETKHGQTPSFPSTPRTAELSEQYHQSFWPVYQEIPADDSMFQLLVGGPESFLTAEHDDMTPLRTISRKSSYTKNYQKLFSTWKWLAMFLTCCVVGFGTTLVFFAFIGKMSHANPDGGGGLFLSHETLNGKRLHKMYIESPHTSSGLILARCSLLLDPFSNQLRAVAW
ncbi:uncharacterized protein [Dermacentor albipictus]|uniref:uncharacterized protein n=1 Tax=Dermacentor albipictus TaxID=60249 RepID=UPI0038FD2F47